jgi:hypothetical protein
VTARTLGSPALHLYIEPRAHGTELTAGMVFDYMVEKGLFRIGATLKCPTCNLANWVALDVLKQSNVCEMCGNEFDATRQLVNGQFHYRRTGVLGLEKNSQGAVPVTLVLQQLEVNVKGSLQNAVFAPSYDLVPRAGVNLPPCEVDLPVNEHDRIEAPAPHRIRPPDGLAERFAVAGMNCPRDAQWPIADINANSVHDPNPHKSTGHPDAQWRVDRQAARYPLYALWEMPGLSFGFRSNRSIMRPKIHPIRGDENDC